MLNHPHLLLVSAALSLGCRFVSWSVGGDDYEMVVTHFVSLPPLSLSLSGGISY